MVTSVCATKQPFLLLNCTIVVLKKQILIFSRFLHFARINNHLSILSTVFLKNVQSESTLQFPEIKSKLHLTLPGVTSISSLVLFLFLVSPRYSLTNYSSSLAALLGELSVPKVQTLFRILMSKYLDFLLMGKILGKLSLLFYSHLWMGRLPSRPNLKNWFKWSINIKKFFRKRLEGQLSG